MSRLAQHAESWGFRRFWMASITHPGVPAATAVVLAHIGAHTSTIVSARRIMLPTCALVVAAQFGRSNALSWRVDLGLGGHTGTDQAAAYALRRNLSADVTHSPRRRRVDDYFKPAQPDQRVRAIPGESRLPRWILIRACSAPVAAMLVFLSFASHFAPGR